MSRLPALAIAPVLLAACQNVPSRLSWSRWRSREPWKQHRRG
jgi:hypothetical protein